MTTDEFWYSAERARSTTERRFLLRHFAQQPVVYQIHRKERHTYRGRIYKFCWCCRDKRVDAWHHITPVSCGGLSVPENFVGLCRRCHFDAHFGNVQELNGLTYLLLKPVPIPAVVIDPCEDFVSRYRPAFRLCDLPDDPDECEEYIRKETEVAERKALALWELKTETEALDRRMEEEEDAENEDREEEGDESPDQYPQTERSDRSRSGA